MSGISSASVTAGPLFVGSNGIAIMAGSLYIHDLNPATAKQWIGVLETIAEGAE